MTTLSWVAKSLLKDAFCHIPVAKVFRPYLEFMYQGQKFQFQSMPLGLSVTSGIFTKVLAHVLKMLSGQDIPILAYLDNLLVWSHSSINSECCKEYKDASGARFSYQLGKTPIDYLKKIEWLGLLWDTLAV